jgi:hypothetical protein
MSTDRARPHDEDKKTLYQLELLAPTRPVNDTVEDAYQLGRCRGRIEGAEQVSKALRIPEGIA